MACGAVLEDAGFVRWVRPSLARAAPEGAGDRRRGPASWRPASSTCRSTAASVTTSRAIRPALAGSREAASARRDRILAHPDLVSAVTGRTWREVRDGTSSRRLQGSDAARPGLEGPFLNPLKRGAHGLEHLLAPSPAAVAEWSPENGIRLATLAPELPGALALIEMLARQGVAVGAGHSMATYDEARRRPRRRGQLWHPPLQRDARFQGPEPGLAGALLAEGRSICGLIADGIHAHPGAVKLAWLALGSRRLNLVTDAMAGLGIARRRLSPGRSRCRWGGGAAASEGPPHLGRSGNFQACAKARAAGCLTAPWPAAPCRWMLHCAT